MRAAGSGRRSQQRLNKIDQAAAAVLENCRNNWAHVFWLAVEYHATFFQPRKLSLNIFGEESGGRDASVTQRFLISLRRRKTHRLQNQFHTWRAFRRIHGRPAEWAHRNIFI